MSRLAYFEAQYKEACEQFEQEVAAAVQRRERAYLLMEAERIRTVGCKIIGSSVEFCQTCGLDAHDQHLCINKARKGDDA